MTRVPLRHMPLNTRVLTRVQGGAAGAPGVHMGLPTGPFPAQPEQTPR